jgi:predicted peptidase
MKSPLVLVGLLAVFAGCASPTAAVLTPKPGAAGTQVETSFTQVVTKTNQFRFLLALPKEYAADSGKRWPLVLFLHGAGERGTDVQKVAVHGPPKLVKEGRDFPFILASPQCPEGQVWDTDALIGLVDTLQAQLAVDAKRTYVTGLSMGGYGTWSYAMRNPGRFAAIVPICGGGEPSVVRRIARVKKAELTSLGVWVFHGAKDTSVPLAESEQMVAALKTAGVTDLQFTVYPEAKHDSWTETYENPDLYAWLLKHRR